MSKVKGLQNLEMKFVGNNEIQSLDELGNAFL